MILLTVLVGVCGLAIGSFLNVVVWRVPRDESVVHPASACPACQHEIRARDNIPLISWMMLRGRCRECADPISRRYPLVEATTAVLFLVMLGRFGLDPVLPAYLYLMAVGLALALIDLDCKRLPDVLTLPSYPIALVLFGLATLLHTDTGEPLRAVLGGVAMGLVYFVLWFAYPAGMGFGDVKLSGLLGLFTAWIGWGAWAVGLFAGFLFGGVFAIGLVIAHRAGRKTAVPFGPFMLVGALVAILAGQDLWNAYLDAAGV